jgi:hypothetical protein
LRISVELAASWATGADAAEVAASQTTAAFTAMPGKIAADTADLAAVEAGEGWTPGSVSWAVVRRRGWGCLSGVAAQGIVEALDEGEHIHLQRTTEQKLL